MMKSLNLLSILYLIIAISVVAILVGYWHSDNLRSKVSEIWKQTLWEDCTNRMREINVKKKHTFSSTTSSNIKIVTEKQTFSIKRDRIKSLTAEEKDFLADQYYLLSKNPVKIEKLDSLFQLKLKENGLNFKTAVFFGDNVVPSDYLKLTYKVNIQDVIVLEGYVKGSCWERILWGKGYYVLLTLILLGALVLLVLEKRKLNRFRHVVLENRPPLEIPQTLPVEPVCQNMEPAIEQIETHTQITLTVFLNERKHTLVYMDKEISFAPKVFGLLYLLSQGKDYFQPYDFLLQSLWTEEGSADKKHLEQIVIRLRKGLKDIPWLSIDTIWGSGYQINVKNGATLILKPQEFPLNQNVTATP